MYTLKEAGRRYIAGGNGGYTRRRWGIGTASRKRRAILPQAGAA
jgi:hypothetical protein